MRKTGPILLLLVGVTQAGREADEIRVSLNIFKILYRLNYIFRLQVCLIYCNVATVLELDFSWLLSRKAYFKVCFEVQKIWLPFFMSIPTIRYYVIYHIPNNKAKTLKDF